MAANGYIAAQGYPTATPLDEPVECDWTTYIEAVEVVVDGETYKVSPDELRAEFASAYKRPCTHRLVDGHSRALAIIVANVVRKRMGQTPISLTSIPVALVDPADADKESLRLNAGARVGTRALDRNQLMRVAAAYMIEHEPDISETELRRIVGGTRNASQTYIELGKIALMLRRVGLDLLADLKAGKAAYPYPVKGGDYCPPSGPAAKETLRLLRNGADLDVIRTYFYEEKKFLKEYADGKTAPKSATTKVVKAKAESTTLGYAAQILQGVVSNDLSAANLFDPVAVELNVIFDSIARAIESKNVDPVVDVLRQTALQLDSIAPASKQYAALLQSWADAEKASAKPAQPKAKPKAARKR